MEQSIFTDLWELSSLNHQMLASSVLEDHGFEIPHFSQSQFSTNIDSPSNTVAFSSFDSSPAGYRETKIPNMIGWSSEQIIAPKDEEKVRTMNRREGFDGKHQKIGEQVLKKARQPYADEHIIAERKRREKLSQQFVALAAIIPGLKKADKASILGDAIKYVKELEQNLKSLEDKKAKRTVESIVVVKNSTPSLGEINDTFNTSIDDNVGGKLITPEIQVWISEGSVLARIHCENIKGVLVKVLSEIEKLHLVITNASAVPSVESFVDITVIAQMEEEFSTTGKDFAEEISSIFHRLIEW